MFNWVGSLADAGGGVFEGVLAGVDGCEELPEELWLDETPEFDERPVVPAAWLEAALG